MAAGLADREQASCEQPIPSIGSVDDPKEFYRHQDHRKPVSVRIIPQRGEGSIRHDHGRAAGSSFRQSPPRGKPAASRLPPRPWNIPLFPASLAWLKNTPRPFLLPHRGSGAEGISRKGQHGTRTAEPIPWTPTAAQDPAGSLAQEHRSGATPGSRNEQHATLAAAGGRLGGLSPSATHRHHTPSGPKAPAGRRGEMACSAPQMQSCSGGEAGAWHLPDRSQVDIESPSFTVAGTQLEDHRASGIEADTLPEEFKTWSVRRSSLASPAMRDPTHGQFSPRRMDSMFHRLVKAEGFGATPHRSTAYATTRGGAASAIPGRSDP